jgi:CHAT domain-containing protein/Tfp pilus assembly protein PilF
MNVKRTLRAGTLLIFLIALVDDSIGLQNGKNFVSPGVPKVSPAGLFQEGDRLRRQGEYDQSAAILSRCLEVSRKEGQAVLELDSLLSLGLVYWNTGKLQESTDYYEKALALAQKISDKKKEEMSSAFLKIYRLYQEGKGFRSSKQPNMAMDRFQEAIALSREIKSPDHEVKCLRQFSVLYWDRADYREFYKLNELAVKISISICNKKEEGRCLNNLGLYYWKIDNYASALNAYEASLETAINEKNALDQADTLHNMGIIWVYLGNYEKALNYLTKAYNLDQGLFDKANLAQDYNTIGTAFIKKGFLSDNKEDFNKALSYFSDSLKLAKEVKDKKFIIQILNNIGSVKSHLRFYSEALEYFELALSQAQEVKDNNSLGMLLNNIGIVYFNLGKYEESTRYYQKAIDVALRINGGDILWEAYLEIANSLKNQKRYEEAINNYENSIRVIEEIRYNSVQEELKASYLGSEKRIDAYQNLIDLLATLDIDQNKKDRGIEAFNYLEKAKARGFLDSLEVSEVNISQGVDFKLANQEKEIMHEISQLYTRLLMPGLSPEDKARITEQLKTLDEKLDTLKREIRTTSPAYAGLKYPEIITLDEAKRMADTGTAFFAYSLGKDRSYGFVLRKDDFRIFRAPARKVLQDQVAEYRKAISDKDNRDFRLGRVLFEELVLPGLTKGTKRIVFVPDDILNLLPFETLVPDDRKERWLVQDYAVAYVPSLSSLRELNIRKKGLAARPNKDLLAFGDPYYGSNEEDIRGQGPDIFQDFYSNPSVNFFRLKYSGLETRGIASLFKASRTDAFLREKATEDRLKSEPLTDYRIIHFATHGLIDDKKPARSSIILSLDQDPAEDGFLQMREVFDLKMNADLVVLSACQTGLGQFIRGEGIEGLSRAFFYAGSSSVLMSLWAVNDQATYQLMERFYRHLKSSENPMNALRRAKLEMIGSKILSHPYYWAGFILNGKPDGIIFPSPFKRWILLASSVCAGIMILLAFRTWNRKKVLSSALQDGFRSECS